MATLDSLPPLPDSPESTQTLNLDLGDDSSLPPLPDSPQSSQAEFESVDGNSEHHMDLDEDEADNMDVDNQDATNDADHKEYSDSDVPNAKYSTTSFYSGAGSSASDFVPKPLFSTERLRKDADAHLAASSHDSSAAGAFQSQGSFRDDADKSASPKTEQVPRPALLDNDLLSRIQGMYRLLELYSEQGSGGLVDKVIISQNSLRDLIESLSPGAYTSLTKIDFATLDRLLLRPVGVYGSKTSLVDFLKSLNAIDDSTAKALLAPPSDGSTFQGPELRSGIYIILAQQTMSESPNTRHAYVIYWPETNTWDDNALDGVRRNRITFMRYLSKLTDQMVALLSREHAGSLILNDGLPDEEISEVDEDLNDDDRLFTFEVQKTKEEEESIIWFPGFTAVIPNSQHVVTSASEPPQGSLRPCLAAGEARQGVLTAQLVPPHRLSRPRRSSLTKLALQTQLKDLSFTLKLGDKLSLEDIKMLLNLGLKDRRHSISDGWSQIQRIQASCDGKIAREQKKLYDSLIPDHPRLKDVLRRMCVNRMATLYPLFEAEITPVSPQQSGSVPTDPPPTHLNYDLIKVDKAILTKSFESIASLAFKHLKGRFIVAGNELGRHPGTSQDNISALDAALLTTTQLSLLIKDHVGVTPSEWSGVLGAVVQVVKSFTTSSAGAPTSTMREAVKEAKKVSDPIFVSNIFEQPYSLLLPKATAELRRLALNWVQETIEETSNQLAHQAIHRKLLDLQAKTRSDLVTEARREMDRGTLALKDEINASEESNSSPSKQAVSFDYIKALRSWTSEEYDVGITYTEDEPEQIAYSLDPIGLTAGDKEALCMDHSFIPKPTIRTGLASQVKFTIPTTSILRHIQLFENGKCFAVVDDRIMAKTKIYLEDTDQLPSAILHKKTKKLLDFGRVGTNFLIAVNETKRLVAILSRVDVRLHTFQIDDHFTNLHGRGTEVDLRRWLTDGPDTKLSSMCFISGSEELLIVEDSGNARIFSLITEQFKPASLSFDYIPKTVFSTPDGSCLMVLGRTQSGEATIRAYHSASFGSNSEGILLALPDADWDYGIITSMGARSNPYLLALSASTGTIQSVRFQITNKTSEYMFRQRGQDRSQSKIDFLHNCLIDCHSDVWTRYPVIAAIPRQSPAFTRTPQTLRFIADERHDGYRLHFRHLIHTFERSTRKPTNGFLDRIVVSAQTYQEFSEDDAFEFTSTYLTGKWLVELLCLIPIHIAITSGNRFIPLKDGVVSSDFERSVQGAEVMHIANKITIGWYESIFQSYMATKPVKVVSSMGEQSVGKSYALNHFVDTSFAGSAMRCTEGAWLSLTPTDDELIVALDFEGIHSIERSAQEDMLLVLFNVALSNLVLFRNNFALSRDIAGLFTSFQSSTSLLDPASNPTLFQSRLAIIIKDVTDHDSREVVKEFSLKFQKIVQDEQEGNFITKLHQGRLDILPWPVIQNPKFYSLMTTLKKRLAGQQSSHGTASMFLQTVKTLMAKLKASDWGALDHNLASHRAQTLQAMLPIALACGTMELGIDDEHLKNMDTDEAIPHHDSSLIFFLESFSDGSLGDRAGRFSVLRASWEPAPKRQDLSETDWILSLASYLQDLAKARVAHVRDWVDCNICRFPPEHADVQLLRRQFDQLSRELVSGVEICAMKCASCGLRCIEGKRHEGEHTCNTDHRCLCHCEMDDFPCGFRAGHDGRHICDVTLHLCGEPCYLSDKRGCQRACVQPLDHTDGVHICGTRNHECGEPCDMHSIEHDGVSLCTLGCSFSCLDAHDRHICENKLTCPVKCQLCKRLCVVNDHFHAMKNNAVHLCGQEHACEDLCTSSGICYIETTPRSVESTFNGKNETFQYTKYTQVANRLQCVIPIPANKVGHQGAHIHTSSDNPFHYCEERCPSCQYFCTLPLGHAQEHDTRHGSMEKTSWAVDGDDDAVREVQGRKFSAGDSGAPMLCASVCKELGRHAHIDFCRTPYDQACIGDDIEHIHTRMQPQPSRDKDWITHALHWARTGFKDPYSQEHQADYTKCDAMCGGEEHMVTDNAHIPPQPSYCTLPLFHHDVGSELSRGSAGYISSDGHMFSCKNPVLQQAAFHVVFVLDRSGSMQIDDNRPLANTPASARISRYCDNRYGAVLSALYAFWSARETAALQNGSIRRDAYSIVLLGSESHTNLSNDFASTADQLLQPLLSVSLETGTNFAAAVRGAQDVMEVNWSSERTPVVIFLSDGEDDLPRTEMYDLCRRAVALGQPLSFHSVSFAGNAPVLQEMADIARQVQAGAPQRGKNAVPCGFTTAMTTISLAQTFLGIADSMRKARSSLIRS